MLNAVNLTFVAFGRRARVGRRPDHRVLRHDRRGRRGRRRPGDRHRAVPAPRNAQSRRFTDAEVVTPAAMLLLIPLLPFLGFLVNAALGRRLSQGGVGRRRVRGDARRRSRLSLAAVLAACSALPPESRADRAARLHLDRVGRLQRRFALRLDPLSAVMILVVTGIGSLIHVYSTAYMHEEPDAEYARYFSYLNLFAAFMLVLVLGVELPGDVRRLGRRGAVLVPADRLLVSEEVRRRRRQEGLHRQPHRRLSAFVLGVLLAFVQLRHARLPGDCAARWRRSRPRRRSARSR